MHEKKAISPVQDDRVQNVPGMSNRHIEITLREREEASRLQAGIKKCHAKGFMGEMPQLWSEHLQGGPGTIKLAKGRLFPRDPGPQLKRGRELGSLGLAEAMLLGQLRDIERTECGQSSMSRQQALPDRNRALSLHAHPQEDGEELRIRQGPGPLADHLFPRTFLFGQVPDEHSSNSEQDCSFEHSFLHFPLTQKRDRVRDPCSAWAENRLPGPSNHPLAG